MAITIVIPEKLVTKVEVGYECDWEWMYNQVKKIIMRLILIDQITTDFLKKNNISWSIDYLQAIRRYDVIRDFEKIVNIFEEDISFTKSKKKGYDAKGKLSRALVETSYIYSICPWEGQILRSNFSLYVKPLIYYRFIGQQEFYLIFGSGGALCLVGIYFPNDNLIVYFDKREQIERDLSEGIKTFQDYLLKSKKEIDTYLNNPSKQIAIITGVNTNFGHSYWNDLTGLHGIVTDGLMKKVAKILVGPYNTMDPAVCFPGIPESKIHRFDDFSQITEAIIANNYIVTRPLGLYITKDLVNRVKKGSLKKCTPEFIESFELFKKQNYPLLWIALRPPNSKRPPWKSQVESLAKIINELYKDYPNLGIIFDGWSNLSVLTEKDQLMIQEENQIAQKIQSLIPQNIKSYNLIGATPYEKIVFADAITTYIAPFGSTLTIVSWIADKTGVSHENRGLLNKPWRHLYSAGFREHMTSSTIVIPEELVKQEKSGYECDCEWIYHQVKDLLGRKPHN